MKRLTTLLLISALLLAAFPLGAQAALAYDTDGASEHGAGLALPELDGPLDGLPEEELVGLGSKAYNGTIDSNTHIVLMDADRGTILFEQHPEERSQPASTTKLMTTLIGVESCGLDEYITAGAEVNLGGTWSTMTPQLMEGETMIFRDLLHGVLLPSGCEAAAAIGVAMAGSTSSFASWMNNRARSLGMRGTHYVNANGVTNSNHYTTPLDLARLARAVLNNDTLRNIVKTKTYYTSPTNKYGARTLTNTNYLLDPTSPYYYQYAIGVKTGTTTTAKYCLAAAAKKNGRTLICVIMHAPNNDARYGYAKSLFEWGFSHLSDGDTELFFQNRTELNILAATAEAAYYYYAPSQSPANYKLGTAEEGRTFLIKYAAHDAGGRLWYLTDEGYFMRSIVFVGADSTPVWGFCRNQRRPLPSGSYATSAGLHLAGTVYADHCIEAVEAYLYNWRGSVAAHCTFSPYSTYFDLAVLEDALGVGSLPGDIYELEICFRSKNSQYFVRSDFTIGPAFTVTFRDIDSHILLRENVPYGAAAIAPIPPVVEGMVFDGWDKDYSFITSDLTVTATYFPESLLIPGDVNGDGIVSFADISELYNYLTGGIILARPFAINADFNGDGEVNFSDVGALYSACLSAE